MKCWDYICLKGHQNEVCFGELDPKRYEDTIPCPEVGGCDELASKVKVYSTPAVGTTDGKGTYKVD